MQKQDLAGFIAFKNGTVLQISKSMQIMHTAVVGAAAGKLADINNLLAVDIDWSRRGLVFAVMDQSHINADMGRADAGIAPDRCKKLIDKTYSFHGSVA
ncbi:hypothetical protein [Dyadobacter sp. 3J3]|uniref:hypothetical protein n=1 Tax=Dyadobacter sp. 3J3 TaxID=2606600 RepID=UPI0013584677|nr:hypothetical protein [Dyadobacter sp. 3J3]